MQDMSERQYAAHVGLSRGAIQKAKAAGWLVLQEDGNIDVAALDSLKAGATDPSKTRKVATPDLKPVPEAAVSAVDDTPKLEGGLHFSPAMVRYPFGPRLHGRCERAGNVLTLAVNDDGKFARQRRN